MVVIMVSDKDSRLRILSAYTSQDLLSLITSTIRTSLSGTARSQASI